MAGVWALVRVTLDHRYVVVLAGDPRMLGLSDESHRRFEPVDNVPSKNAGILHSFK